MKKVLGILLLTGVGLMIKKQWPQIKRYVRIERM